MDHNGVVYSTIRRSNLVLLLCSLIAALVIGIIAASQGRFFYNAIIGPFPLSSAEAASISKPDERQKYYVTIQGDDVIDTGYYYSSEDNGVKTTEAVYWALLLGDHLMLVKARDGQPHATLTGTLQPVSDEERQQVIIAIGKDVPDLKPFTPVMLQVSDLRNNGLMAAGLAVLGWGICLALMLLSLYRLSTPESHPIYKSLTRMGEPNLLIPQVEQELSLAHVVMGGLHITPHWVISLASLNLNAMRLTDLIWYYKHVTQVRYYGIPTHKKVGLILWDRYGKLFMMNYKDEVVTNALAVLAKNAPWAMGGYNPAVHAQWNNFKTRQIVIDAVDARRRSV
jgi:hypothetical protein